MGGTLRGRWSVLGSTTVIHRTELNATWVLMFSVLFSFLSCVSLSPTSRPLLSGRHFVSRLLGSHLHRTYLLDGLILSSCFSGLVVWWCLVCLSPCPLSPHGLACGGSQDGPFCPRRAALPPSHPCPTPVPTTLQGVCALPHTVLTACGLGRGATHTFLCRFQGFSGNVIKPEGQSWSPKPLRNPMLV